MNFVRIYSIIIYSLWSLDMCYQTQRVFDIKTNNNLPIKRKLEVKPVEYIYIYIYI